MDAKSLAAELTPKMHAILESNKSEILDQAGGWIARKAIEAGWPVLLREVPTMLESGIELLAWKFGKLSMEELMDLLLSVRKSSPQTGILMDQMDGQKNHSNIWANSGIPPHEPN